MQVLSPEMRAFLTIGAREEAVWEPRYHYQSYAAAGFTSQSYFGQTVGSVSGGLRVTNMEKANAIGNPKRFSVEGIAIDYVPGSNPSAQAASQTTLDVFLNDIFLVSSVGAAQFRSIDKVYLNIAPLWSCPPGRGLAGGGAAVALAQATAADRNQHVSIASIGIPALQGIRWLKAPIPLQSETPFFLDITYTTAVAVTNAGTQGVSLEGLIIRPLQ